MSPEIRIAASAADLDSFLDRRVAKSAFQLKEAVISKQREWHLKNGVLAHVTGGFFYVAGYRDVSGRTERLVLFQPQGALNGLAIHKSADGVFALLQARIERAM